MRGIFRLPMARLISRLALLSLVVAVMAMPAMAQNNNNNNNNNNNGGDNGSTSFNYRQGAVGGVLVGADGVLQNATIDQTGRLQQLMQESTEPASADMQEFTPMRKISLRKLEAAIQDLVRDGKPIPADIFYLAGIQQIEYVFVYPDQKDIVLAGPGEGWTVGKDGAVVGVTTGRPVMTLDDLVIAIRSAEGAQRQAISCSIDPRPEGVAQLQQYANNLKTIGNPPETIAQIEQTLGPQTITVTGVPDTSHFARVLVAADYQMKRIAMNFEPSPVPGLPSFLGMMKAGGRGMSNMMPRWWLEPSYESVVRSPDGLAWEMKGATVKAMTEEDFFNTDGSREHTGRANPMAQRWADMMTKQFDRLAVADPIFGELRNCMELAITAGLIVREDLPQKAGYSMPTLLQPTTVEVAAFPAPKQVDSKASVMKKGRNWLISASGGVQINTPSILKDVKTSPELDSIRTKAESTETTSWWWN